MNSILLPLSFYQEGMTEWGMDFSFSRCPDFAIGETPPFAVDCRATLKELAALPAIQTDRLLYRLGLYW